MAEAAEAVCTTWRDGAELDPDAQCRMLTLRALGRSVLGLDIDDRPARSLSRCVSRRATP
jgi:hypothetical protein